MCLDEMVEKQGNIKDGFGYKVFARKGTGVCTEYKGIQLSLPTGEWINEKDYRNPGDSRRKKLHTSFPPYPKNRRYGFGWHIFEALRDAKAWTLGDKGRPICKVRYRKAHTLGIQARLRVVVATEMKVLEETK